MSTNHQLARFGAWLRERIQAPGRPWTESEFNQSALELFELQFACNEVYRRFSQAKGASPGGLRHWWEIPALPASGFKEVEVTSLPRQQRTVVFYSSGTTQQERSRHFHNRASLQVYEASLVSAFQERLGAIEGMRMISLTPTGAAAPHSSLVHMFETLKNEFQGGHGALFVGNVDADGTWSVDVEAARASMSRAVKENRPVFLMGTAFLFVHLADALSGLGARFELPPGSRAMETGGYKGRSRVLAKPDLHRLVSCRFGIPTDQIVCEYGMSELSSQAYDRVRGQERVFEFPQWTRVKVVSPETGLEVEEGRTGLLRIYDLANVYSAMAIQTEDLGIWRGHGFELLGRAPAAEARGCSLMAA